MSLYFCGIDISKYKHDCCIICAANQQVVAKLTFKNDRTGFEKFLSTLNSLQDSEDIRIGFESTSHYALNLELFLESSNLSFMEVNPVLISEYRKSSSLRRTKTDSVDCETIVKVREGNMYPFTKRDRERLFLWVVRLQSFTVAFVNNVSEQ